MKKFVKKHIGGSPIKGHAAKDFREKKGVIIFSDCEWDDAAGHIDLFDGKEVEGNGYFDECGMALLYELK